MARVHLGLGSNLGDREGNLRRALRALGRVGRVEAVSSLYETEPVGGPEQPPYLNAACCLETALEPRALLRFLKGVEGELGRREGGPRWGPRPIDLDILLYEGVVLAEDDLALPHPRLAERAFALVPLAEIDPEARHPLLGRTVRQLLGEVGREGVRLAAGPGWWEG